jgi:2-succinyl-5-enolpyruvyl-6-hydroxy-3-cyclohexene-1-carboxylate synthase
VDAPERLAGVERGVTGDLADLLSQLDHAIQVAAQTIRQMSPADRLKQGIHIRYGTITVAQVIEQFIVAHAEEHLAQIQAALRE